MKHLTLELIQKEYPEPIRAIDDAAVLSGTYCVMGAAFLAHGDSEFICTFPSPQRAADYLFSRYPGKGYENLLRRLEDITIYNDSGDFQKAWEELESLLNYLKEGDEGK